MSQEARIGAFNSVPDESVESPASLVALAERALGDEFWKPPWADGGWYDRFEEEWDRLMVRLAVGGRLATSQSIVRETDLELLQDVIVAASQSSAVGKIVLESRLKIDSRRPTVEPPSARARLEELAKRYHEDASVSEKEALVSDARTLASDAQLGSAEVHELLTASDPGKRIVGLAAVQALADPESFNQVMELVHNSRPFEQFHALSALESLRPGLTDEQREQAVIALRDAKEKVPEGSDRGALVERILTGIERDVTPLAAS
jgi:hypothetical protein